jgi:hypothetical protein
MMFSRTTISTRAHLPGETSETSALVVESDNEHNSPFVWLILPNGFKHCVVLRELRHALAAAEIASEFA